MCARSRHTGVCTFEGKKRACGAKNAPTGTDRLTVEKGVPRFIHHGHELLHHFNVKHGVTEDIIGDNTRERLRHTSAVIIADRDRPAIGRDEERIVPYRYFTGFMAVEALEQSIYHAGDN